MKAQKLFLTTILLAVIYSLTSCSVESNQDIRELIFPREPSLALTFSNIRYNKNTAITLPTTYQAVGDAMVFSMSNKSAEDEILVQEILLADSDHFVLAPFSFPTDIPALESKPFSLTFNSTEEGTFSSLLTVNYTEKGRPYSFTVILYGTRSMETVSQIAVFDSDDNTLANNNTPPYNFGYDDGFIDRTFTIRNTGEANLNFTTTISNNSSAFSILTAPVGPVIPGAETTLTVRRLNGTVAANAQISIVSNAGNFPSFTLNVASLDFESGAITILDPALNQVSNTTVYDLGYAPSGTISRNFTIENSGLGELKIFSVSSSNSARITIIDKPASGTILASGASATFTLQMADPVTAAAAAINVVTDAVNGAEYIFNVFGGSATIQTNFPNSFPYRISGKGYDFGYAAAMIDRTITLTNTGTTAISLDLIGSTMTPATRFVVQSVTPSVIPVGSTAALVLRYTPLATEWSEATFTLRDIFNRSYTIYLTGSGFKQPNDIETTALWLRTDRIAPTDVETDGFGNSLVVRWPDGSGRDINAEPPALEPPKYVLNIMNGQSVLEFNNNANATNVLRATPPAGTQILNAVTGSTIAVIFKTAPLASSNSNRIILQPYFNTSFSTQTFGQLYLEQSPTNWYRFRNYAYAYTAANSNGYEVIYVYPQDYSNVGRTVAINTIYSVVQAVDFSIPRTTKNRYMWINGADKVLGDWSGSNFRNLDEQLDSLGAPILYHNNINYYTNNKTMNSIDIGRIHQVAEVIIYPKVLSGAEMTELHAYLTGKFGMAVEP